MIAAAEPVIVLVGELNPYGPDERYAFYDEPVHSAGGRLRRKVLELPRRIYFGDGFRRHNLCHVKWGAVAARERARVLRETYPDALLVLFGRKVAAAFGHGDLEPFTAANKVVVLPHPSGLCRVWDEPGAFERARTVLRGVAPHIPWGSL